MNDSEIERLSQAVDALKADLLINRQLIKKQQHSDRQQQAELDRLRRMLIGVVAAIGLFLFSSNQFEKLGDEQVSKIIEIAGYLLTAGTVGGTIATSSRSANEAETSTEESEI